MAFGDYQFEIYLQGLGGIVPSLPMTFDESEVKAEAAMPATSNFPQRRGRCLANDVSAPVFRAGLSQSPDENMQAAVLRWISLSEIRRPVSAGLALSST